MTIKEIKGNLFSNNKDAVIAHCISSDYALGAGIAVEVQKKYKIKQYLKENGNGKYPECIFVNNVFNLVTKNKYWNKPTYENLRQSLEIMKGQVLNLGIKKLNMPKIGSGLDRLQWPKVREIIKEVFDNTDIEISVYYL